jgi:hypothetical protein
VHEEPRKVLKTGMISLVMDTTTESQIVILGEGYGGGLKDEL